MAMLKNSSSVSIQLRLLCVCSALGLASSNSNLAVAQHDFGFDFDDTQQTQDSDAEWIHSQVETKTLTLGLKYISDESWQYGHYNEQHEQGVLAEIAFDTFNWQRDTGLYWHSKGALLDSGPPDLSISVGRFDQFKLNMSYLQFETVANNSGRSPYRSTGGNNWVLPSNWQAATSTFDMSQLNNSAVRFNQELERERFAVSADVKLNKHWSVTMHAQSEEKTGEQLTGAAMYFNAANGFSALLPSEVDQQTHQADFGLSYANQRLQFSGQYNVSVFDNQTDTLSWQNAYQNAVFPAANYPDGIAQIASSPDNQFQQLRLQGALMITPQWRAQWDLASGETTQDDTFLAYTINSGLTVSSALPRTRLDGEIDTFHINLALIANPWKGIRVKTSYRYDERDNNSPRDLYVPVPGDGGNQVAAIQGIYNAPTSSEKDIYSVKASIRLPEHMQLTLGYEFTETGRTNSAVFESEEDSWLAKLRWPLSPRLMLNLSAQFNDRQADTYHYAQSFGSRYTTDYINSLADSVRYKNHPLLRQYYIASREQDILRTRLGWMLSSNWTINADLMYEDTGYDESVLGLTDQQRTELVVSADYFQADLFNLYTFFSFTDSDSDQASRQFRGGTEALWPDTSYLPSEASDVNRDWYASSADQAISLGVGGEWFIRADTLTLSLDYVYVDTEAAMNLQAASALVALESLPDNNTALHDLKLELRYVLTPQSELSAQYRYYRYSETDWALDSVGIATIGNVLATGQQPANESISMVGVSYSYHFD